MKNLVAIALSIAALLVTTSIAFGQSPQLVVNQGHAHHLTSVAFSPDGSLLATGSWDKTAKLWHVATGKELRTFSGHLKEVTSVVFSPDSRFLLTGSWDNTAKLWEVTTGRELRTFRGHSDKVSSVAISPDGRLAVTGSEDKTAKLWEVGSGKELRTFSGDLQLDRITSVALSPDSHFLMVGSRGVGKIWEVTSGRELATLDLTERLGGLAIGNGITSVAFSPDGRFVVTGTSGTKAELWETHTGKKLRTFSGHLKEVTSVVFSPDGRFLLTGSGDNTAKLWEVASGKEIFTLRGDLPPEGGGMINVIPSVAFSLDGRFIVAGDFWNGTAKLWDVATGQELRRFGSLSLQVKSVALSPEGRFVATGSEDLAARLWEVASGKQVKKLGESKLLLKEHISVAFSPDSRFLTSVTYGAGLTGDETVWEVTTGKKLEAWSGRRPTFSPNGHFVATHHREITAKLQEVETGKELRTLTFKEKPILFSPDGRFAVIKTLGGAAKLWDVVTGQELWTVRRSSTNPVAFSPDGRLLVVGDGNIAKLREVASGKELRTFQGHSGNVISVAFSPDGRFVITGSSDHTAKLWQVATGKEIRTFRGHSPTYGGDRFVAKSGGISAVAFSPDGRILATASGDRTAKLWEVESGKELRTFQHEQDISSIVVENDITSVAFSPDGRFVATGGYFGKRVKIWEVATARELRTIQLKTNVKSVAFSPDGRFLVTGINFQTMIWDAASGKEIRTLPGDYVALSSDGRVVITSSVEEFVKLWDVANGKELRTFSGRSAVFSPDGRFMATIAATGANLWDIASGWAVLLRKEPETIEGVSDIAFSADGRFLVLQRGKTATLWDRGNRKEIFTFEGTTFVFSPNGYFLAVATGDSAKLYDLASGQQVKTFGTHVNLVTFVTFSPDSRFLVTGGQDDNTIKLWEVASGKEVKSVTGAAGGIPSVAFSPGSRFLATANQEPMARIWDAQTGGLICSLISFDKDDWVVVTPDGRFDGSPDGLKQLHYVQNNEPLPLDSFFDQFYTPGLLARVLSGESARLPTVDLSKGIKLPPRVKIISPKAGQSFMDETVQITVEATDEGGGIDEIRLYQNGKRVWDALVEKETRGKKTKIYMASLVHGMNEFRATAFNKDRTESPPHFQHTIRIELKAVQAEARLHVLAIGINDYKNASLKLGQAKADAEEFLKAVDQRGKAIFKEIIPHPIYNAEATRERIEAEFQKIAADARPQDVFVLFYSGHGTTSEGSATRQPDFYFALTEVTQLYGDDALLETKGLSATRLRELLAKVKALKQLVVVDACEAGGLVRTFAMRGAPEQKAIAQLSRSTGSAVLASTGTDQFAAEFKQLGHGIFTYALLRGLAGEAAREGKVTVNGIDAYLQEKVPELTKQHRGSPQYPMRYMAGQDFPLVGSPGR